MTVQGGAKKTGPPSHCKYSEIPRPNCVEIGELLSLLSQRSVDVWLATFSCVTRRYLLCCVRSVKTEFRLWLIDSFVNQESSFVGPCYRDPVSRRCHDVANSLYNAQETLQKNAKNFHAQRLIDHKLSGSLADVKLNNNCTFPFT